jgi:hypothetical protein
MLRNPRKRARPPRTGEPMWQNRANDGGDGNPELDCCDVALLVRGAPCRLPLLVRQRTAGQSHEATSVDLDQHKLCSVLLLCAQLWSGSILPRGKAADCCIRSRAVGLIGILAGVATDQASLRYVGQYARILSTMVHSHRRTGIDCRWYVCRHSLVFADELDARRRVKTSSRSKRAIRLFASAKSATDTRQWREATQ